MIHAISVAGIFIARKDIKSVAIINVDRGNAKRL
jgi:hypothetical protein